MSFKPMLTALFDQAREWTPEQFLEPQIAETRQVEGLQSEGRVRNLVIGIDEPLSFGGTDRAPNPVEVTLAALGASLEVTCRVYADYLGIPVHKISTVVRGDLDLRGFLDLDPQVRAGPPSLAVTLRIESEASDADIDRLVRQVHRSCPVLSLVRDPTPVSLTVERPTSA